MTTVDDRPEGGLSAGVQGPRTDPGPVGSSERDTAPDRWRGGNALLAAGGGYLALALARLVERLVEPSDLDHDVRLR